MSQSDVHVSRAALRDSIRDDLSVALKAALQPVTPGMDGAPAILEPDLVRIVDEIFAVPLPPPDEHHAEVSTIASVLVHAICPRCGISAKTTVDLSATLVVDSPYHAEIRVAAKSKARTHVCGQEELPEGDAPVADGQVTVDDLLADQEETEAPAEGDGMTPDERLDRALDDQAADGHCPFPGCARAANHRGKHRDADGVDLGGK